MSEILSIIDTKELTAATNKVTQYYNSTKLVLEKVNAFTLYRTTRTIINGCVVNCDFNKTVDGFNLIFTDKRELDELYKAVFSTSLYASISIKEANGMVLVNTVKVYAKKVIQDASYNYTLSLVRCVDKTSEVIEEEALTYSKISEELIASASQSINAKILEAVFEESSSEQMMI